MRISYKYVDFPDDLHKRNNSTHEVHVTTVYNMTTDTYEVTITHVGQLTP